MAAKYFVWGEGVWRELDVASGRVSGWRRRARFVFVRRGRLLVARRGAVLHALAALGEGRPSAAADGPRLSQRSKSESRTKRQHETLAVPAGAPVPAVAPAPPVAPVPPVAPAPAVAPAPPVAPPTCEHHHCCVHKCYNNEERVAPKRHTATQCAPPALDLDDQQKLDSRVATHYSSGEEFVTASARRPVLSPRRNAQVNELFGNTPASDPPAEKQRLPATTNAAEQSGDRRKRATKRPRAVVSDNTDCTSVDEPLHRGARWGEAACKELVISDADVALLRGYVSRTNASALQRFDADDAYKRSLFYAINPLVQLERCERLEVLLHTASLGLVPARRRVPRRRRSSADTDKENKDKHSSQNKVREPVSDVKKPPGPRPAAGESAPPTRASATRLGVSERSNKIEKEGAAIKAPATNGGASDPPRAKPERSKPAALPRAADAGTAGSERTHVISKRASQPAAKEYSNLEDHAIVAWLSGGARARLVGGNRVWRELQEQYERLTGRERSWHSLRNRYLRYILPSLGALQLPPDDVARLRAAAATGAIKTKNRLATRRHSAYETPVRGASSRRPREGASSDDTAAAAEDAANGASSPKRRSLRSRPPESASKDTSNKDESGNESATKASGRKEVNSRASIGKQSSSSKEVNSKASGSKESGSKEAGQVARSPRYSDVTRRFAARRRPASSSSAPPSSRSPSPRPPPSPPTRSRRLYNPNAHV